MSNQISTGQPGTGDLKLTPVARLVDPGPLSAGYELSPEQAAFFKAETGIDGDDDLKGHILALQEKAHKVFPYESIRSFLFLKLGVATVPEYKNIIKLGQERPEEFFLDLGCCFGVDARKVAADGFPLKNIVTTDLMKEFYDLGHALFNTTPATYPITFVSGDIFDPDILRIVPPSEECPLTGKPDLTTLASLNPLAGRCSVIFASNFFHLFSEANQLNLAKALAGLLSPQPGSMICGEHSGNFQKGIFHQESSRLSIEIFQHCPESWTALWDGEVFERGKVKVNVKLEQAGGGTALVYQRLQWSVVRL